MNEVKKALSNPLNPYENTVFIMISVSASILLSLAEKRKYNTALPITAITIMSATVLAQCVKASIKVMLA